MNDDGRRQGGKRTVACALELNNFWVNLDHVMCHP